LEYTSLTLQKKNSQRHSIHKQCLPLCIVRTYIYLLATDSLRSLDSCLVMECRKEVNTPTATFFCVTSTSTLRTISNCPLIGWTGQSFSLKAAPTAAIAILSNTTYDKTRRHYCGGRWGKGKAIPVQPWEGPEGSRRLRLPDS
jgi:hypothetical protein